MKIATAADAVSLRARLSNARVYLCTDARKSQGDLAEFLDDVLAGGVDVVQLREKGLEAREELGLLEVFRAACDKHAKLLAVNDRADVALAAGADVLHVGQGDLPPAVARQILGARPVIGLSTHSQAEAAEAAATLTMATNTNMYTDFTGTESYDSPRRTTS